MVTVEWNDLCLSTAEKKQSWLHRALYMPNFPWIPATLVCMVLSFSCDSTAFQCCCSWPKHAPCPLPGLPVCLHPNRALVVFCQTYCANSFCETTPQDRTKFCFLEYRKHPGAVIRILVLCPKVSVSSTHWGAQSGGGEGSFQACICTLLLLLLCGSSRLLSVHTAPSAVPTKPILCRQFRYLRNLHLPLFETWISYTYFNWKMVPKPTCVPRRFHTVSVLSDEDLYPEFHKHRGSVALTIVI